MEGEIGFVGLGEMGRRMALRLLKVGFSLAVHDLRPDAVAELAAEGVRPAGARAAKDAAELARDCRTIALSLPDTAAVESVLLGSGGLGSRLAAGTVVIDFGTTHPLFTRRAAAEMAERGVTLLDAPVSGMAERAEAGTLTVMVGGDEEMFERARPVFEAVGEKVVYMGAPGNGQLAKMTNNVLFNISCAAMAEILPMAVKMGLDAEKICSVVSSSTGQSRGFDFFSALVLARDFVPGYPMESARKDMDAVMEIARELELPLPVTSGAMETYEAALAQGLGGENKGAMVKVWEAATDVEVRRAPAR